MQYKIDLHTHSIISHDGGITEKDYEKILQSGILDCIAITDHNDIRFARKMQKKFGDKIIIGEEISTTDGDMIGLFLEETVPPGQNAKATAAAIHAQKGLVYIPHPFETLRKGLKYLVLDKLIKSIDIVETFNGRAKWRGKAEEAKIFAQKYQFAEAASSDAHCYQGMGSAFSVVSKIPAGNSLKNLLKTAKLQEQYAPVWTMLCPLINKMKNKIILTN